MYYKLKVSQIRSARHREDAPLHYSPYAKIPDSRALAIDITSAPCVEVVERVLNAYRGRGVLGALLARALV